MRTAGAARNQFEEQFEDSEANFSDYGKASQGNMVPGKGGQPLQLLKISPTGRIELNEEALGLISSFEGPVGFATVAGKARSGKSCLLNRLLRLSGKGFQVDASYSSCTKGIWMWSEPEFNSTLNNYVFFVDTEGSDSLQKDYDSDTKIFTLALLLSSYFIYNSVGSIDERSLSELEMVTALGRQIRSDEKLGDRQNQESLYQYMPKFMWLLRDFTLNIEDERHNKLTPTQYLENCLAEEGKYAHDDSKKIKKSITNYFKERECMTLVRPVNEERDLQRLNTLPDFSLRAEFQQGVKNLRQKILTEAGPKTFDGQPITGPAMASMMENYVECFNSGKVPSIRSAWDQIAQDEGAVAYNRAIERYEEVFHEEFPDDKPKGEELYSIFGRLREETMREFEKNSYGNANQQHLEQLKGFLKKKEQNILEINGNVNQIQNNEILKSAASKLKVKIESNTYMGRPDEFKRDMDEMVKVYNREAKGERKGEILTEFMSSLTPYMTKLDAGDTEALKEEHQRDAIRMRELEKKLSMQKKEMDNMKTQLKAKDDVIKADKMALQEERKKNSQSCCEVM